MPYANNKDADQPAHLHCLISTFVVHCLDSVIHVPLVSIPEISSLYIASVAERGGLYLTWSGTPKAGFLVKRLIFWSFPNLVWVLICFTAGFGGLCGWVVRVLTTNHCSRFEWLKAKKQMSSLMTKPTKCHVRPAKTQISLGIRPVWSSLHCRHEESFGP